jgi:aspartate-semialdehyde dehydrogenase
VSVFALVDPTRLVGKELREVLDTRRELWSELRLLASDDDEVGTLTEVRGAAAVVGRAEPSALADVDLAFFCGPRDASLALAEALPEGATALLLGADAEAGDGLPLVAGVNLDALEGAVSARVLISPHPGAVLLAHVLAPLAAFGLEEAVATLIQPVSMYGESALDELYDQSRRVIALTAREPAAELPGQLAFNLFPSQIAAGPLEAMVETVLGGGPRLSVEVVQGPMFHSFAAAVYARLAAGPNPEEVRQALGEAPSTELADEDDQPLGPIDAAGSGDVLVGPVRREPARDGRAPGYWIWSVMDNLTRGGALNAVEIAERLLGTAP